jgi:hypothetical protein
MALQSSGAISFANIQTVFGGTNPISLSEYYQNANPALTAGVSGIPNIGSAISLNQFYGKAKPVTSLYSFTTHTFTNAGAVGRTGPIISQVRSAYSLATWAQNASYLNMTTQGIQEWTVPATDSYTITVAGAAGGNSGTPGKGALMSGTFSLTKDMVLAILVGQQGGVKTVGCNSGGGGGTFVWNKNSTSQPLIVAGGGGGGGGGCGTIGSNGQNSTNGGQGTFATSSSTAGSNGNGATPGGSGWLTNGTSGLDGNNSGSTRPLGGGLGGAAVASYSIGDGGFGGGASASGQGCSNGGPGGGGGYSGGAGPAVNAVCGNSGGGGSYNRGTNQTNTAGANTGHGYVTITVTSANTGTGTGTGTVGLTNYNAITATSAVAFSYIAMPGGSRTLLNYLQSFGVSGSSSNTGSGNWVSSYSGDISYTASPISNNNYFTNYGRVRVIDGDGTADGMDWAVFNFGPASNGDFDGYSGTYPYFGGENTYSGGNGGLPVSIGYVWGYTINGGWTMLYQLSLPGDSTNNHLNGGWFVSGGYVTFGNGKRSEYDNSVITHLGFSVS